MGSIPGQGAKILHTVLQGQKKKKNNPKGMGTFSVGGSCLDSGHLLSWVSVLVV